MHQSPKIRVATAERADARALGIVVLGLVLVSILGVLLIIGSMGGF